MFKNQDFLSDLGAEPERSVGRRKRVPSDVPEDHMWAGATFDRFLPSWVISKKNSVQLSLIVAVSFIVVLSFVNAVFLQNGKHPAPLFADNLQVPSKPGYETGPSQRDIILSDKKSPAQADPLIAEMQQHLATRGYYNASVDGILGARTRAAIGLYQRVFDLEVTNEATPQLLHHIQLSSVDRTYHAKRLERLANADRAFDGSQNIQEEIKQVEIGDPNQVKQVQRALSELGYNLVEDGVAGKKTRNAIIDFKTKRGLSVDDTVDVALLNELVKLKKL